MITAISSVPSPPSSPVENDLIKRQSPDIPSSLPSPPKPTIIIPPTANNQINTMTPPATTSTTPNSNIISSAMLAHTAIKSSTATIVSNQGLSARDFQSCRNLLGLLQKHTAAYPFLRPVDPIAANAPDYFSIVKYPMDLSTVEKKLNSGLYNSVQAFGADIELMFSNCFRYNPDETHPIYKSGKQLKVAYNNLLTSNFPTIIDAPASIPTTIYQPAVNTNVYQPPTAVVHQPHHVISHPQTAHRKTLANSVTANRSRRKSIAKRQWDGETSLDSLHRRQSSSGSLGSLTDGVVPNETTYASSTPSLLPHKKPRKRTASSDTMDPPAKRRGRKGRKNSKASAPTLPTTDPSLQLQVLTQQVAIMSAMLQQATAAATQQSSTDESDDDDDSTEDSEMEGMDANALQQQYLAAYASAFAQPVIDATGSDNSSREMVASPTNSQPESPPRATSVEPKYSTRSATRALNPDAESPKPRRRSDPPAPTIRNRKSYKKSPRRKSVGQSPAASTPASPMAPKKIPIINGQIVDSNYLANLAERITQLSEEGQVKIAEFVKTSKSGWTTDLEGELEIDFDLLEDHVLARIDDYCRHHLPNAVPSMTDNVLGATIPPYDYTNVMLPVMDFGLNPIPMAGMAGAIIDDINFEDGDDQLGDNLQGGDIMTSGDS